MAALPKPRDPLLAAARIILIVIMGALALATLGTAIVGPVILLFRGKVEAELAANGLPLEAVWALVAIVAIVAFCAALGFFFFRHLYRIVGTVGAGDPFIPANASRLSAMGWIVVAVNLAAIPLVSVLHWFESMSEKVHTGAEHDFTGVLLALILFILARVFREGTRMREELEGTV
ncbi:MAG: DUF2975 domain-containing protein [Novosphingobium sp.]